MTARAFSAPVAGRYHLLRKVGSGNMSMVFLAQDTRRSQRSVAVKLLNTPHKDELKEEIFRRETKALAQLEHPNIVSVLDSGWSREYSCHYLVFDYFPRTLLEEISMHSSPQDQEWCWPLMRQMADALVHAHSQGVIHRDVKPSNVLIESTGQPKLVDFGVSLLKFELATGVTVSSFISVGYASPEQRRGEAATEQSDIYALGCVFYHMLARKAPPAEGYLTQAHVNALPVSGQIKQILTRMLASDLHDRFESAVHVRRRLEITHRLELLPEVYLHVTDRARRDLFDNGCIVETSSAAACDCLMRELGEDTPKEVQILLDQGRGDIRILTETMRLICVRDPHAPMLVIKAIHVPYPPQLEQERSRAISLRYLWQVASSVDTPFSMSSPAERSNLNTTLNALDKQLAAQKVEVQVERKERLERKDFTRTWGAVLELQQEQLASDPKLDYITVMKAGDTLIFQLRQPAPDGLAWPENAPLAVLNSRTAQPMLFVGHVQSIRGNRLTVSRDAADTRTPVAPAEDLPASGEIGLFQQEAKVSLERQQAALNTIRDGTTVNARLSGVLLDLSTAEFDAVDPDIEFVQKNLAEDKQNAVRQALAARDLFVLQGPPGTGKTTTLAEIILQILRIKPDARILVASQSNIAVNHILSKLAELQGTHGIEMVRVGRAEKIGHGAQVWTIEQRLETWRDEVMMRTDMVLADLKGQLRQKHQAARASRAYSPSYLEDMQQCQQWLEEIGEELADLSLFDDEVLQRKAADMQESLILIRETLSPEVQGEPLPTLDAEWERLSHIVTSLLLPGSDDSREQELVELVTRWRKMFGKQEEFARPILERANVLAATCLISGGYYLRDQVFDYAILDEAGRATAPELLIPLVRSRRAIIVGDERQLPPMLDEDLSHEDLARLGTTREQLSESLFATLVAQGRDERLPAVMMLTAQHRMHPAIGQMISSVFYNGKLTHAVTAQERDHQLPWLNRAVTWFSTASLERHSETRQGSSYYNRAEIQVISYLLHQMERTYRELGLHREVAVIAPYNAQVVELIAELTPESSFWQALSVECAAIDGFQGRDRDIVFYSTVRSNTMRTLGFLRDRRRLNVALSRARQALLIVGDMQTLERGWAGSEGNPYQELIRYLRLHPEDCLIEQLDQQDMVVSHA